MSDKNDLSTEFTPAKETSKRNPRPPQIKLRLNAEVLAAIDRELSEEGLEDRAILVERLLTQHVERRKRERLYRKQAHRTITTESGQRVRVHKRLESNTWLGIEASLAASVWRREESLAARSVHARSLFQAKEEKNSSISQVEVWHYQGSSARTRFLAIRCFGKELDGSWRPSEDITFSRSLIPWLIQALQEAEAAIQMESKRNREKAQEARASRTAEEIAQYNETRRLYIERYSKERVNQAVRLAGAHRRRARNIHLTEHFTAWQWLDLCARSNFRCVSCGAQVNLEPHHRVELYRGGSNTIDNIEPLCSFCHRGAELKPQEKAELWIYQQKQLFESFQVRDEVREEYSRKSLGVIVELFEAKAGTEIPEGYMGRGKEVRFSGALAEDWIEAHALIERPWGKAIRKSVVKLSEIKKTVVSQDIPED